MHNLHNTTTGALFAHMLLLNCNLHYLHIAFYTALKVVCANFAPTTLDTQKIRVVIKLICHPQILVESILFRIFAPTTTTVIKTLSHENLCDRRSECRHHSHELQCLCAWRLQPWHGAPDGGWGRA